MYSLIIKICKLVKDTSRHNLQYELVVTQDFVNEIFALLSQPNHSRGVAATLTHWNKSFFILTPRSISGQNERDYARRFDPVFLAHPHLTPFLILGAGSLRSADRISPRFRRPLSGRSTPLLYILTCSQGDYNGVLSVGHPSRQTIGCQVHYPQTLRYIE